MNILFVCTGNLCRSPMAEALMRKLVGRAGRRDVSVRSAGTHAMAGKASPSEAVQVANQAGVDLSNHRAQPLSQELIDWAERIVVMAPEHVDFIEVNFPGAVDKVEELASFRPGAEAGDSIRDPYGLSLFHYRQFFGELLEAMQGFYSRLSDGRP